MSNGTTSRLAVVCLGVLFAIRGKAQNCSNADYAGTYFVLQQGTYLSSGSPVSYAALVKVMADGNGGITGTGTEHNGAALVQSFSVTGSYSVNADCSGSETSNVTPASGASYTRTSTFQLINGGRQKLLATTDKGTVVSSVAYRAAPVCNNAAVAGQYAGAETGLDYSPKDVFAAIGEGAADGQGNIRYTYSINDISLGLISAANTTATYSIAPDCSGTASFNGGQTHSIALVEGGLILGLQTVPGLDPATGILQPVGAITTVPHVALNGGWNTDLFVVNNGQTTANVQINFMGADGTPAQLPILNQGAATAAMESSATVSVPAHANAVLHTVGNPAIAAVGAWAQAFGSGSFTVYAVFGWPINGQVSNGLTQAVSYNACGGNTSVAVPYDNSGGRYFGIAVTNLANTGATITATVVDATGTQTGQGSPAGQLTASGHTQFLLSDVVPASAGAPGTVTITSSAGPLAVTPLQFNANGSFTSVPVTCQ